MFYIIYYDYDDTVRVAANFKTFAEAEEYSKTLGRDALPEIAMRVTSGARPACDGDIFPSLKHDLPTLQKKIREIVESQHGHGGLANATVSDILDLIVE